MENINIAIVSDDKEYGKALTLSLLSICRDFVIRNFDSRRFISQWASHRGREAYYNTFDLVLWAGQEISEAYGGNIIYLAEKPSMVRRNTREKKYCLYKYSPAGSMVASIFEIYTALTGRKAYAIRRDEVSIFAFTSYAGGTGCTTISLAVAQELCRFCGKKVLYITLEDVESTGEYFRCSAGTKSTTEFLYRLLSQPISSQGEELPFLESYVVRDLYDIEAFAPSAGKNPLRELKRDEIQKFIASLSDSGRFDAIVMDLGSCLTEAGAAAMELAESLCLVAGGGITKREERYLSQAICMCGEKIAGRFIRALNDRQSEAVDQVNEEGMAIIERQVRVAKMRGQGINSGMREILLEDKFGEDIRNLTRQMMIAETEVEMKVEA